jgi:IS30 family transposase
LKGLIRVARKFKNINYTDRRLIAELLTSGLNAYDIAERVSVAPASIYRELRRGLTGDFDEAGRLIYDPDIAEATTKINRRRSGREPRQIVGRT